MNLTHGCTDKQLDMSQLDMSLAKSYQPGLICVVKVLILTGFHTVSGVFLFPLEIWGLVAASLLVDKWVSREFVLDSNGCVLTVMSSLLVHELRDAGVSVRGYHPLGSSLVLAALLVSNILVTSFGESWCMPTPLGLDGNPKRFRVSRKEESGQGHILTHGMLGPLICLLNTCGLLLVLGTCTEIGSSHDLLLTNLRVWSFTVISLVWFYTVNYRELGYGSVASFTPCLVRFSSVLYMPSPLLTLAGVGILTTCIAATYLKSLKGQASPCTIPPAIGNYAPLPPNKPATVVREASSSSAVSYRIPVAQKQSTLPKQCTLQKQPVNCTETAGTALMPNHPEGEDTPTTGDLAVLDYNYLFEQASLGHLA